MNEIVSIVRPFVEPVPPIPDVADDLLTQADWDAADSDPRRYRGMSKDDPISVYFGFPKDQRHMIASENYKARESLDAKLAIRGIARASRS